MSNITDKFKTTDPAKLLGKIDAKRLEGVSLRDNANIMIVDTIGRYVKDPEATMTAIVKIEDKLGEFIDKYTPAGTGELITKARDMVTKGLDALKKSGIIGPDGKFDLDALIKTGGEFLSDLGLPIISTIKDGIKKLRDLGDALGITKLIDTAKGWYKDIVGFIDGLVPDFIKDVFKNLNWDNILEDFGGSLLDKITEPFQGIASTLIGEWWWYDKERKLYNYDTLSGMHPLTLKLLGVVTEYDESDVRNVGTAIRKHYYTVERSYRAMRQYGNYR